MNDSMSSSRESLTNRNRLRKSDMNSSSVQFDLYRRKNAPALLDEIVSLIESSSYTMNPLLLKKSETIKVQLNCVVICKRSQNETEIFVFVFSVSVEKSKNC